MSDESTQSRRTLLVCAFLLVGTMALFGRAMTFGFLNYDDPSYVVNNPHVQAGLTADGVRWAFAIGRDYWHPLTWLSLMLDRELFSDDARGYHAVNVVWHALNALLVLALVRRAIGTFWAGALAAAFFAWHPLRVESVAWITERKDVLSGFFALLAVAAYLRFGAARAAGPGLRTRAIVWYVAALAAFACGLMSKSVLVTLPFVFLLLDAWPLGRLQVVDIRRDAWRGWARLLVEKAPFLTLSLAAGLATVATQDAAGAFTLPLPFDQRLGNAAVAVMRYLGKLLWPSDLAVVYPHPGHWPAAIVLASAAGVLGLTTAAWWLRRTQPWLLVGWGWFLLLLLPVLGLLQVGLQAMADRYTYLPSVGTALALAGAARAAARRSPPRLVTVGAAAVAMLACVLATRTWRQQAVWRDAETLFAHALAVTRNNYVAHTAVALGRLGEGRIDDAVRHAEQAVAIAPDAPLALDTLAAVRAAQGRTDEAIAGFRRVLTLQPQSVSARCDLGRQLLRQGRLDDAETLFREARDRRPVSLDAHLGLADVASARARHDEALVHLEAAQVLRPRDPSLAMRVAAVQLQLGRTEPAAASLVRATVLAPDDAGLQRAAGDALGRVGQFPAAAAAYERALVLAPMDASTHARLGYVYFLLKRPGDAIRSWERALELDPSLTELKGRIRRARDEASRRE